MLIYHPSNVQGLRAVVVPLANGARGIKQTTKTMADLVQLYKHDPQINATALSITQLVPSRDALGEVNAVFKFVRDNLRYVSDVYGVETLRTPDRTLALRAGDCDDLSLLLCTLLQTLGYECKFAVTGYAQRGVYEHIYVLANVPGVGWVPLDPSDANPAGWEPPAPVAYYEQEVPV